MLVMCYEDEREKKRRLDTMWKDIVKRECKKVELKEDVKGRENWRMGVSSWSERKKLTMTNDNDDADDDNDDGDDY